MATSESQGCGGFKRGNGLAEDELLCAQHIAERLMQLIVERLILAFEVQHGNGREGVGDGRAV